MWDESSVCKSTVVIRLLWRLGRLAFFLRSKASNILAANF
jgi:hypothetical protein